MKKNSGKSARSVKKQNFQIRNLLSVAIRPYTDSAGNKLKNGEIMKLMKMERYLIRMLNKKD